MPLFAPVDVYRLYLPKDISDKYTVKFKAIGFIHIIIATISIVIEGGAVVFYINRMAYYPSIAPGIWAGALFLFAGIFAILSAGTGKYCHVIASMVFAVLSFLGGSVVICCNAYFARLFMIERMKPIAISMYDEDTKLIPPLLILVAASFCELILCITHFGIGCAATRTCFCCVQKREMRDTEIRLNYPRPFVRTVSSHVTRADSFKYQGPYDTVTTNYYPSYSRREFNV
uniref:uncharacterized protein LOC120334786 n=1 Tax=Styela clava TaxID=7725 RepID=UPI0019392A95|nr:uncharacterized protein LOC120334786 [Styela clava]XP_039258228.1 uncharacterized protein LOC120334787 [Styela clava]